MQKEAIIQDYLNKHNGFINEKTIHYINQYDTGSISNVIKKLCPHAFGIILKDAGDYSLFYVNNEDNLRGFMCELNFLHPLRNDITYAFSSLVNKYFPNHTRLLRVFNNYQTQTITLAEKLGYTTYGDEINPPVHLSNNQLYIPLCNKIKALQNIFMHDFSILQKKEKNNYIYLMYNFRNDFTKIGRSINPLKREKTLQGEVPELEIIAFWQTDKMYEKILHQKFENKRKRGEWFDLDVSDFLFIKHLMDQQIDN